jgi:16S rRNA (cytosine967-C5)-methyltransferase
MPAISAARLAAFEVLRGVAAGGLSDVLLAQHTAGLDSRDAGLAEEIALGVLRRQLQLDFLIEHFGGVKIQKLDQPVLLALRMGVYQLRYLDRIPAHAAVAESVELVKRAKKRSAAGLVNAVLRKVTRDPIAWPTPSLELSTPDWLLRRWNDKAKVIGEHSLTVPISGMDPGSRSIVPLLNLEKGMSFLDLCAAPGNKTRMALELEPSVVIASDRSFPRLRGVPGQRVQLDATQPLPFRNQFDRILVDAPCSGTGTLARNPEIKWRLQPEDLLRHQQRQRQILRQAWEKVKPGGRLVYSTCSLEPEENEEVVAEFPVTETVRRWPGIDDGDGFFAAILEKR